MRVKLFVGALAVLLLSATAWASSCDEETIDTVSEDGDLIVLSDGNAYDVVPGDEVTASEWQEGDSVLMCGDKIINKDEDGESIDITPH
ncbi:MAG TPA: hypothetical protein VN660_01740 [Steroidobacteraceae bacterium]|nr:hypothetical protein [Steroidobacteraceae bacterium]